MQSSPIGKIKKIGSVEIPDLTSIPEIHDEPVFDGYRKGGFSPLVRDSEHEKIPKGSSLCRSGGGEAPKNVVKTDDFYRAKMRTIHWLLFVPYGTFLIQSDRMRPPVRC